MGRIQTTLGNPFRDKIADKCEDAQYTYAKEKNKIGAERIPEGAGFGPVDVFVIDRQSRRFVLVEVKDIASEGTTPRLVKEERDEFQKIISKLQRQTMWFSARVQAIQEEYRISPEEDYRVEGVVVVNGPRLWMYTSQEPLPVVGDIEFLSILKQGGKFQTTPAP